MTKPSIIFSLAFAVLKNIELLSHTHSNIIHTKKPENPDQTSAFEQGYLDETVTRSKDQPYRWPKFKKIYKKRLPLSCGQKEKLLSRSYKQRRLPFHHCGCILKKIIDRYLRLQTNKSQNKITLVERKVGKVGRSLAWPWKKIVFRFSIVQRTCKITDPYHVPKPQKKFEEINRVKQKVRASLVWR